MKFSEFLAQDPPLLIGETFADSTPIAYAWGAAQAGSPGSTAARR